MDTALAKEWRLRAHNQFLTFGIAFGIPGSLLLIFCFLYPIRLRNSELRLEFWFFLAITLLSMLAEDTLETSAGAMFVGYFYSLYVFAGIDKTSNNGSS